MHVLAGRHGWWLRTDGKAALLPPEAVDAQGALTPPAQQALRQAGLLDRPPARDTYYLTVLTSTLCNLGCGYCFQNTAQAVPGRHNPPRIKPAQLSQETIGKILRFAGDRMTAAGAPNLHILLFGGEPLLNPLGCVSLLRQAAGYGLADASRISNGVLLRPALARKLADAGLRQIKITFDGDRRSHDSIRTTRGGGATYDTIVSNIAQATEATCLRWDLRVNVSHQNAGSIAGLIDDLADKLDPARCAFDFALVDDIGIGYGNDLSYNQQMQRCFIQWHLRALELGFGIGPIASLDDCSYCSTRAGQTGAVINADGILYSCWESAGKPGWEVGDIANGYLPDEIIEPRWVACDYDRQGQTTREQLRQFFDKVEAAVLDWQYEHRRL